jgi:hypothetical protein
MCRPASFPSWTGGEDACGGVVDQATADRLIYHPVCAGQGTGPFSLWRSHPSCPGGEFGDRYIFLGITPIGLMAACFGSEQRIFDDEFYGAGLVSWQVRQVTSCFSFPFAPNSELFSRATHFFIRFAMNFLSFSS